MKVAIIGLGKMGKAIAYRAVKAGLEVIGFDPDIHASAAAHKEGIIIVKSLAELAFDTHIFWLMVPHEHVDSVLDQLKSHLRTGDIIIDGGNSHFVDSIRRAEALTYDTIFFLDCGTSGGVHGQENGFCLMIGGQEQAYQAVKRLLHAVAAPHGYAHVGPSGAGHYVKMVHNGIEYGLLQAYAEGFEIMKEGTFKNSNLDLAKIADLWNHGAVIRSWILSLVHDIMKKDQNLHTISGEVESTGMGRWTIEEAQKHTIPAPVIEESLKVRAWSKKTGGNYATKIVALLRNKFGGHEVKTIKD